MSLTEAQLDTVNSIRPRGLMLNSGEPCECGGDDYRTTSERKYSDSMVYHHTCKQCGNEFSTWTEG